MRKKPTETNLRRLYEAALAFKAAKLWEVFDDTNLIGVENPATGEMGYCTILGKMDNVYGLDVFLGDKGLAGFFDFVQEDLAIHEIFDRKNSLTCIFVDRHELEEEDLADNKRLGFAARGQDAWIQLRRYEPGYIPWFISDEECVFLGLALEQVLLAGQEMIVQEIDLAHDEERFFTRYLVNGSWQSEIRTICQVDLAYEQVGFTNELAIQRLKQGGIAPDMSWQIDTPLLFNPIQENEGDRPILPRLLLLMDENEGAVVDASIFDQAEADLAEMVFATIFRLAEESPPLPGRLVCRDLDLFGVLDDFCQKVGIELVLTDRLDLVNFFMEGLAEREFSDEDEDEYEYE